MIMTLIISITGTGLCRSMARAFVELPPLRLVHLLVASKILRHACELQTETGARRGKDSVTSSHLSIHTHIYIYIYIYRNSEDLDSAERTSFRVCAARISPDPQSRSLYCQWMRAIRLSCCYTLFPMPVVCNDYCHFYQLYIHFLHVISIHSDSGWYSPSGLSLSKA